MLVRGKPRNSPRPLRRDKVRKRHSRRNPGRGVVVRSRTAPDLRARRRRDRAQFYSNRVFVADRGLISYGPSMADRARLLAGYVDRILRGEKPADLPVQAPVRYETVLNLKTAKALGIEVPASILVRADEVIE